MLMRSFSVVFTILISMASIIDSASAAVSKGEETIIETCPTTVEYVTTLEFLRAKGTQWIPEETARQVARKVVTGCGGASKRFIRVTQVLSKAGLTPGDAIDTGIEFSGKTDAEAEAFVSVFQKAFLSEYLDLDLNSALRMARSLSIEFNGDVLKVRDDFEALLEYCINGKQFELPVPTCGTLAARIAKLGEDYSGGTAAPFIKAVEFLKSNKGPGLATGDALKLAEELIRLGYSAVDNFTIGFKYAYAKSGLSYNRNQALVFAKDMASLTRRRTASKSQ